MNFSPNGEWEVKGTKAKWMEHWLGDIPITFSKIRFSMTLKRKVHLLVNTPVISICVMH